MLPTASDLANFIAIVDSLGLRYAIGGSVASSLWSSPRTTHDVDIALELVELDVARFLKACEERYIVSESEVREAIELREYPAMFQVLDPDTLFRVDVFVMDRSAYAKDEIGRIRHVEVAPKVNARVLAPENIVLRKLLWYQLGNRVSDRQWNDIIGVIEVQGPAFDRAYVRKWAEELGVLDLAEEAFAESKDF